MVARGNDPLSEAAPSPPPHPRTIGWIGTTALAMGGSNQSLFLIGALLLTQGSAAVPLLILGLLLSWAAAPGWTELVLMRPNRVGGIAATCAEAFRPYSPVLANLTGVCYWWGWVPTCGLTALLSATAIKQWYLPMVPLPLLATGIVLLFTLINLCGVRWVTRFAIPCATVSAILAFASGLIPILTGNVNWHQALDFQLISPFPGFFGSLTSAMAGLYLVGFAAPYFEAATCHVGETIHPACNVPRAVLGSALMATVFFALLPVVWLGVLGPVPLMGELTQTLGQHPAHGFIPPDQFVVLAEQAGLIAPPTHWVLETAIAQCRSWLDNGLKLAVAVNLSMWNLRDATLPDTIASLLTRYNVSPHLLRCEITETAVMADTAHTLQVLNRLFALGLCIAIDDFGTGYASLSYLKNLPADELKIDRAFVQHLTTDVAEQAIVRSTVNMAHSMGMQVVAEGVEDQATWDLLTLLKCDIAQGYYLSRPVPAQELEGWLRERKEAPALLLNEEKEAVAL